LGDGFSGRRLGVSQGVETIAIGRRRGELRKVWKINNDVVDSFRGLNVNSDVNDRGGISNREHLKTIMLQNAHVLIM
jgi:hypothetical protein